MLLFRTSEKVSLKPSLICFSGLSGKEKPSLSAPPLVTFRKSNAAPRQPLPGLPLTLAREHM